MTPCGSPTRTAWWPVIGLPTLSGQTSSAARMTSRGPCTRCASKLRMMTAALAWRMCSPHCRRPAPRWTSSARAARPADQERKWSAAGWQHSRHRSARSAALIIPRPDGSVLLAVWLYWPSGRASPSATMISGAAATTLGPPTGADREVDEISREPGHRSRVVPLQADQGGGLRAGRHGLALTSSRTGGASGPRSLRRSIRATQRSMNRSSPTAWLRTSSRASVASPPDAPAMTVPSITRLKFAG